MLWDRPGSNSLQRVMDFSSTSSTYTGINMHNINCAIDAEQLFP